jgi:hypothetical protein
MYNEGVTASNSKMSKKEKARSSKKNLIVKIENMCTYSYTGNKVITIIK